VRKKVNTEKIIQFGENHKKIRLSKGITQIDLASSLNVEICQISRIERGIINTSLSMIYDLAEKLEINPCELFKEN